MPNRKHIDDDSEGAKTKIGEQTMFSLQFVVVLIGIAIWLIRLDDRSVQLEKDITLLTDRVVQLEQRVK